MAGPQELNSFYLKFVNLWKSGSNAKLFVETFDGEAFVNLQVGLGQAQPQPGVFAHRGGGPAKQRRRERREAARSRAAEEADAASNVKAEEVVAEEIIKGAVKASKDDDSIAAVEETAMGTSSPIPQIDGALGETKAENIEYKLTMESHPVCTIEDIKEAIEVNFNGSLDDEKIQEQNDIRYLDFKEIETKDRNEIENEKELRNITNFRVVVKDHHAVKMIIEGWKERYKFDELAFANYSFDGISTRVLEVQRLR